jgi:hypothetical protein
VFDSPAVIVTIVLVVVAAGIVGGKAVVSRR